MAIQDFGIEVQLDSNRAIGNSEDIYTDLFILLCLSAWGYSLKIQRGVIISYSSQFYMFSSIPYYTQLGGAILPSWVYYVIKIVHNR